MKELVLKRGLGIETKIEVEDNSLKEEQIIFSGVQKEKIMLKPFAKLTVVVEKNSKLDLELIQENEGNYEEEIIVLLKENSFVKLLYSQLSGTVLNNKNFVLEKNSKLSFEERNYGLKTVTHSTFTLKKESKLDVVSKHVGKKQEHDSTLEVIHEEKSFASLESRNLLNDSTSLTRGIIRILKKASGTETEYISRNIVFGDSEANTIPELDIHNENVSCKHGASIETINEEQIYYLMSRGLDKNDSINVITSGLFEEEILNRIK